MITLFSFRQSITSFLSFFLSTKNRTVSMNNLFGLIHFFLNMLSRYVLMISCSSSHVSISENEEIVFYVSSITWSYFSLLSDNFFSSDFWQIFPISFIYFGTESIFNLLSLQVIRTLLFFIQFLFKIIFRDIDLIYIVIICCLSEVLNYPLIHFLRTTLSLVTVLVSVSYVVGIVLSSFFYVQVSEITVVLVLESISLFSVITCPSFCMVTERVIKFPNPDSSSVLGLLRFSTCRRL